MSDDNDTAGRVNRKRYGRSDKANARENRNPEFQEGYAKGIESLAYDPLGLLQWKGRYASKSVTTVARGLTNGREVVGISLTVRRDGHPPQKEE